MEVVQGGRDGGNVVGARRHEVWHHTMSRVGG